MKAFASFAFFAVSFCSELYGTLDCFAAFSGSPRRERLRRVAQ